MTYETEIKLRIGDPNEARNLLESREFRISVPRIFERNLLMDTSAGELRGTCRLLRLRQAGTVSTITYKGVATAGKHKAREERETAVANFTEMHVILERLGYRETFSYEKYRTEYHSGPGVITIDETPIGNFLEVEGPAEWIDSTASLLGFTEADYLTASYGTLYRDWCRTNSVIPANMTFTGPQSAPDRILQPAADPV